MQFKGYRYNILVIKLDISVMGIHRSCKFGDSTSKVKEGRDSDVWICDGWTDGKMDGQRVFLQSPTGAMGDKQWGTEMIVHTFSHINHLTFDIFSKSTSSFYSPTP